MARDDFLLVSTVTQTTLVRYSKAVEEFENWASTRGRMLSDPQTIDRHMSAYFVALYDDGFGALEGRDTYYGFRLLRLRTVMRGILPISLASLKGWSRRAPNRMRLSAPEDVVLHIALQLVHNKHPLLAFAVCLQLDSYLRPTEVLTLRMGQVCPPAPRAGRRFARQWAIVLGMQEWGERTKSGSTDDSVLVADKSHEWLPALLRLLYDPLAKEDAPLLPGTDLSMYEKQVTHAARELGYAPLHICPHVFRHSGASNDDLP